MPQIGGFLASWRGWAKIIVIVLHAVGGICMALGDPISLVLLTPAHLCITTFVLFSVHPPLNKEFYKAAFLTFIYIILADSCILQEEMSLCALCGTRLS